MIRRLLGTDPEFVDRCRFCGAEITNTRIVISGARNVGPQKGAAMSGPQTRRHHRACERRTPAEREAWRRLRARGALSPDAAAIRREAARMEKEV